MVSEASGILFFSCQGVQLGGHIHSFIHSSFHPTNISKQLYAGRFKERQKRINRKFELLDDIVNNRHTRYNHVFIIIILACRLSTISLRSDLLFDGNFFLIKTLISYENNEIAYSKLIHCFLDCVFVLSR